MEHTGTWIFLGLFFAIIVILIIVAIIGSRKDKNEKLIENDRRSKLRLAADTNRIIIFISLNKAIKKLFKEISNYEHSTATRSLGDVNREYTSMIKNLNNSTELKEVYLSEDYSIEIKPIMKELVKIKPSNWSKDATFATGLIFAKAEAIETKAENKDLIKIGKQKKWN